MRSSQARASLVTVIACGPGAPKSARIVPAGAGTTGESTGAWPIPSGPTPMADEPAEPAEPDEPAEPTDPSGPAGWAIAGAASRGTDASDNAINDAAKRRREPRPVRVPARRPGPVVSVLVAVAVSVLVGDAGGAAVTGGLLGQGLRLLSGATSSSWSVPRHVTGRWSFPLTNQRNANQAATVTTNIHGMS